MLDPVALTRLSYSFDVCMIKNGVLSRQKCIPLCSCMWVCVLCMHACMSLVVSILSMLYVHTLVFVWASSHGMTCGMISYCVHAWECIPSTYESACVSVCVCVCVHVWEWVCVCMEMSLCVGGMSLRVHENESECVHGNESVCGGNESVCVCVGLSLEMCGGRE